MTASQPLLASDASGAATIPGTKYSCCRGQLWVKLCALGGFAIGLALILVLGSGSSTRPYVMEYARARVSSMLPHSSCRPVFLMHGLMQNHNDLNRIEEFLAQAHPGSLVFPLRVKEDAQSLDALPDQLDALIAEIRGIINVSPDSFRRGYDLVCHSNGALLCRVLCQVMDDHNVHTLVSLAGPQMGVYGETWFKTYDPSKKVPIPGFLQDFIEEAAYENFFRLAYTSQMQTSTSVANLWHDPLHEDSFLKGDVFLPWANSLRTASPGMKANFIRLKKAVFLTGSFADRDFDSPNGIEPWCTGNFAFYAAGAGAGTPCVPLESQDFYIKDTIGLKTLSDSGRLHVEAVPGASHGDWKTSPSLFAHKILPHLD